MTKPHYKIRYDLDDTRCGCASCAFNSAFLVEGAQACPKSIGRLVCENQRGIAMTWFEKINAPITAGQPEKTPC